MQKTSVVILVISLLLFGFTMKEKVEKAMIPEKKMTQVGIIVKDVEASAKAWTKFLGLEEVPKINISENNVKNPTMYKGKPTDAQVKMAFFYLDNITIELLEPVGGPSTWQEFLDEHGEGIHHIAFDVNDTQMSIKMMNNNGIELIQYGGWDTGEYSYMDGKDMGLILELLEHYNR